MTDLMFYILLSAAGIIAAIALLLGVIFLLEARWERRK